MIPRSGATAVSLLLGTAVLFSGCWVRSLQPIGGEGDAVFDERLVGTWVMDGEKEGDTRVAVFSGGKNGKYDLVHVMDGRASRLEARLVRVGDHVFLELAPTDPPEDLGLGYIVHILPAYSFLRISVGKKSFEAVPLDYEWLAEGLRSGKLKIPHQTVDKTEVLTASTEELRGFLLKHAEDGDAFAKPMIYRRR